MKTINPVQPRVKHSSIDTQVRQKPGLFMYHKETGTISAEASTLSIYCQPSYAVCSIINVINPKTGGEMAFMLTEFQRCPVGEIQAFIYTPCRSTEASARGVKQLKIFND
jgi:hypothetical protein